MSSFGCMFAPATAWPLASWSGCCAPAGGSGLLTWPPGSDVAEFLRIVGPTCPRRRRRPSRPCSGATRAHVHEAFEGAGVALELERGRIPFPFGSLQEANDVYFGEFGPLVAARALLEPQGRWQPLADDISAYFARHLDGEGRVRMDSDYTIVLGRAPG